MREYPARAGSGIPSRSFNRVDRYRLAWWGVAIAGCGFALGVAPQSAVGATARPAADAQTSSQAKQQGTANKDPGAQSYSKNCAICHGDEREGILPGFPPLAGIKRQLNDDKLTTLIRSGKGRMPGFPLMQSEELSALLQYLGTPGPALTT